MNQDPLRTDKRDLDRFLYRLVVAAVTIFVTVSLLLAAFVVREIWIQQQIVDLSANLQDNLAGLEETTEVLQNELSEIEANIDDPQALENLDKVAELLTDADQQLGVIEEEIGEVTSLLEVEPVLPVLDATEEDANTALQDRADQVFTIFAVLTGIAGIAIALLLGVAVYAQTKNAPTRNTFSPPTPQTENHRF
jgi:hypothetical protein